MCELTGVCACVSRETESKDERFWNGDTAVQGVQPPLPPLAQGHYSPPRQQRAGLQLGTLGCFPALASGLCHTRTSGGNENFGHLSWRTWEQTLEVGPLSCYFMGVQTAVFFGRRRPHGSNRPAAQTLLHAPLVSPPTRQPCSPLTPPPHPSLCVPLDPPTCISAPQSCTAESPPQKSERVCSTCAIQIIVVYC